MNSEVRLSDCSNAETIITRLIWNRWILWPSFVASGELVRGRLRFDHQNGAYLKLFTGIDALENSMKAVLFQPEVIPGLNDDNGEITLTECIADNVAPAVTPTGVQIKALSYHAHYLIIGEHLSALSDVRYSSLVVRCHNLEEFIGLHGFSLDFTEHEQTLKYTHPTPVTFSFGKFKIAADYMFLSDSGPFRKELCQKGELTISADREIPLEDFVKGPLTALMYLQRLSVGNRIPFVSLEGRSSRPIRTFNGQVYEDRIGIYFNQSRALPLPASKDPYELMFTLAGFGDQCSAFLTRWYSAFERFRKRF